MDKPKLTISILISRNYEGVKRCLDSVRPILEQVPSELILTDTGCGAKVRKLIEGYTDNIIDFEWIKDFSAARNVGLEEAKKNGSEWFLYIDDDEWFDDVSELVRFFNSGECDRYNVGAYIQRNYLDMDGKTYGNHNVDRIIRISPGLHFEHRIHEAYTGIDIGKKKRLGTIAHHFGYVYSSEEEKVAKSKRNRDLLELECREYPEDMRIRHQLMMDYYGLKQYDEAIRCALEGIKMKSDSMYWDALHTDLLYCLKAQNKWDELIEYGEGFLRDNLFPFDKFGVQQYLICAYWSVGRTDEVCKLSPEVINTYIDYKKNPDKYDANQLMRDEFWQEDNISRMLLFIIDSALANENEEVIEYLQKTGIREDMEIISQVEQYRTWLTQMVLGTCQRETQRVLFDKLPFKGVVDFEAAGVSLVEAPVIEFHNLQFEPDFFEAETRDGFYIEPLVKNAWAAQLETLSRFDKICEENNLTYSLDWGTLLGAVRHKGYIPWDDDLDVCMMREDLIRFYEIIPNYPELELLNPYNTPDLGIHASRLNLSRDFTIDRDRLKDLHGFPLPVGIDIFTVDYVPRDKAQEKELIELMLKANYAAEYIRLMGQHDSKENTYHEEYLKCINELKELGGIEFSEEEPGMQELVILYDEIQSSFSEEDADYISELPNIMIGREYYLPKDTYKKMIRVPFENIMVNIPANYDKVLRIKYGDDYMTPGNVGGGHDYPFYNKLIEDMLDINSRGSFESTKEHIVKISGDFYKNFLNRCTTPALQIEEDSIGDNNVRRIQAALLEVLEEVKRICDIHDIRYYYINGTETEIDNINKLAGDSTDIHLGMMREDYMRFQQIVQEELDPWFDYRSIYTHRDHTDMRMYIITDAYMTGDGEYEKRFHGCNDIVGIDIAAIDYVNDDDSVEQLKVKIIEQVMNTGGSLPAGQPYSEEIMQVVKGYEDLLGISINTNGNLCNEFVKVADNVAMSDNNVAYSRVRISSDIIDGNYRLYDRSYFEV